jgi:hypothetical protein
MLYRKMQYRSVRRHWSNTDTYTIKDYDFTDTKKENYNNITTLYNMS